MLDAHNEAMKRAFNPTGAVDSIKRELHANLAEYQTMIKLGVARPDTQDRIEAIKKLLAEWDKVALVIPIGVEMANDLLSTRN